MPTVQRNIAVQYGATAQSKNVRADGNLATLVGNVAKNGITKKDVDKIIRSPQLNDRGIVPGTDAYANKSEGAVLKPLMAAARDRRKKISIDGQQMKFTTAASADYFLSQVGKFFATKGAGQAQTSRPATRPTPTTPTAPTTPVLPKGADMAQIQAAVNNIVDFVAQATTQEPVSGARRWSTQMRDVVTFAEPGARGSGSLERAIKANGVGAEGNAILAAARYAARRTQGASNGVLAFIPTPRNLETFRTELMALYTRRDANNDGVLTKKEIADGPESSNVKALMTGSRLGKLANLDTSSLRTELAFSQKVNQAVDLFYGNGNINNGRRDVERLASRYESQGNQAAANVVRAIYPRISRYVSNGRTASEQFICRDQRREVTRAIMTTFGGRLDNTEKAISALS